jgi:hypothetical protein
VIASSCVRSARKQCSVTRRTRNEPGRGNQPDSYCSKNSFKLRWRIVRGDGSMVLVARLGSGSQGSDQPGPRRPSTPHRASAMRCLPHCTQTCMFGSGLSRRCTNLCSPNRHRHALATLGRYARSPRPGSGIRRLATTRRFESFHPGSRCSPFGARQPLAVGIDAHLK